MPLSPAQSDLLAPFLIPSLPPSFYYIPNFITPEEEAAILRKAPKFQLSSSILTSPPSAIQEISASAATSSLPSPPHNLALPVPLTFFRNTDPPKPLDLPKPPAPTSHPLHARKIQHASRRSAPHLPSQPHNPTLLRAGHIRDNPAQSAQPHPDK